MPITINVEVPANRPDICLIYPSPSTRITESVVIRVNDMIRMIQPSAKNIYLIINNNIVGEVISAETVKYVSSADCPDARTGLLGVIQGELRAQIQIIIGLIKLPKQVKILIWKGRSSTLVLPIIVARLLRKKSILFVESQGHQLVSSIYTNPLKRFILSRCYKIIDRLTRSCSDKMVVWVPKLLEQMQATKQKRKIFPYPVIDRFVSEDFKVTRLLKQRQTVIGYIGRMSAEKGILNLVQAILLIYQQRKDVQFMLGGDGPLLSQTKHDLATVKENGIRLPGWISYADLPIYLNEIKLLVVPSYYEALPVIVLEAMACGTPVLTTPVGALPDIITSNENGFIMKDNSPECIAENILRALACPDLETISVNGQNLVNDNFTLSKSCQKWQQIISSITI